MMPEPIASRLAGKFWQGVFFLASACDSGEMDDREWYVLVREDPSEDWICVGNLTKAVSAVLAQDFLVRGLNYVVGYAFPVFCGCPSLVVAA